jgi:hypothetical protein
VPAFYTSLFESKIKGAKQLAVLRDAIGSPKPPAPLNGQNFDNKTLSQLRAISTPDFQY